MPAETCLFPNVTPELAAAAADRSQEQVIHDLTRVLAKANAIGLGVAFQGARTFFEIDGAKLPPSDYAETTHALRLLVERLGGTASFGAQNG